MIRDALVPCNQGRIIITEDNFIFKSVYDLKKKGKRFAIDAIASCDVRYYSWGIYFLLKLMKQVLQHSILLLK